MTLIRHTDAIISIVELKDGRIASASSDSTIRLWDFSKDEPVIRVSTST